MKIRNSCTMLLFLILLLLPLSVVAQDYGPECEDSNERYAPENSRVTRVKTDGYSGSITYKTNNGNKKTLAMNPVAEPGGTLPTIIPMSVSVNENPASLEDLVGKVVQELKVLRRDCYTLAFPGIPGYHLSSRWIVMAKLSDQQQPPPQPGGKLVKVRGKIAQIEPPDPNKPNEVGRLVVKGKTIVVTKKTKFKGNIASDFSELKEGMKIKARGKTQTDNTIKAKVIKVIKAE